MKTGPRPRPPELRFAEKTRQLGNGCIEWTAGTNRVGYGVFHPSPKWNGDNPKVYAHRWAYEQKYGRIPDGMHLDHLCRNTLCVNPDHLEPVTPAENLRRGVGWAGQNARKTHCIKGHPLSGSNLYVNPTTRSRHCRECARIRGRARYPRKRK